MIPLVDDDVDSARNSKNKRDFMVKYVYLLKSFVFVFKFLLHVLSF